LIIQYPELKYVKKLFTEWQFCIDKYFQGGRLKKIHHKYTSPSGLHS